jgi:hypothetical protein
MSNGEDTWIDPDIDLMTLSGPEKAGLQVYRNYNAAFERDAIKRFRNGLAVQPFDTEALIKLISLLSTEDIRFLPIVFCGFADECLATAFKNALPEGIPGGKSEMFGSYGPISDLSKRIRLAYSFDIMSQDLMMDADKVRKARNRISHDWDFSKAVDFYRSENLVGMFPLEGMLSEKHIPNAELISSADDATIFRVRLIWLSGRLSYESSAYHLAKANRLVPVEALYLDGGTSWLQAIAKECLRATRAVISPQVSPT